MYTLASTKTTSLIVALSLVSSFGFTTVASAVATTMTPAKETNLQTVITAGDAKITKRLTDLDTLNAKITSMTKLSATDKTSLQSSVSSAKTGLTQLKTKLDAETTLASAKADAKSAIDDYRVYMLVIPKVRLVKVADNQLVKEDKLITFAADLQTRAKAANNSEQAAQAGAMLKTITDNKAASQAAATTILALQAKDYNADHAVMKAQSAKLAAIHDSNVAVHKQGLEIAQALGYKLK